jgi:hypothetical protein
MPDLSGALQIYARANDYVVAAGLEHEVAWQRDAELALVTETILLREAAWVVLCSGFRESVVRRVFDHISLCFCDWESAASIIASHPAGHLAAQASFRSTAKLTAIVEIARRVDAVGFEALKSALIIDPITTLRQFPYIGPITVWHLAKNLGFDAPKPDRHLVRISKRMGFNGPRHFCAAIAEESGDAVKVIDLVIWRYLADNGALAFV